MDVRDERRPASCGRGLSQRQADDSERHRRHPHLIKDVRTKARLNGSCLGLGVHAQVPVAHRAVPGEPLATGENGCRAGGSHADSGSYSKTPAQGVQDCLDAPAVTPTRSDTAPRVLPWPPAIGFTALQLSPRTRSGLFPPDTRERAEIRPVPGSSNTPRQAVPLFGVEPVKGFVKEFDRVRLLLGPNNRL